MHPLRFFIVLLISAPLFLYQCNQKGGNENEEAYKKNIRQWREKRLQNLKSPDGWLNLAGLYWLDQGKNTLGSDSAMDVVFPEKAPDRLGTLFLKESQISFVPHPGSQVQHEGKTLNEEKQLKSDAKGEPTRLTHGSLKWFVIKRGEQYALRLRDLKSPLLEKVDHIPAFPVKPAWKIRATFVAYNQPRSIEIPNALGGTYQDELPGELRFEYDGKQYTLYPTGTKENLFVVFGDHTNAEQTYGGGRFLSVEGPDKENITFLDFNKAYNPPCAFTPYATCPLPPKENILPFKVQAGEKAPDIDAPYTH